MKLFLPIALLCLFAVVSCKKAEDHSKEKSRVWSEKKGHNVKKYNQEKFHHHEKHQKAHAHENPMKHESYHTEPKQHKVYHEVPKHEAELQKDIKSSKKEIADRLATEEQDLHLQDLTHPDDPANAGHKDHKSPHHYQRGHHKTNHHFSHSKGQKSPHHQEKEEKLFVDPEPKKPELKQSHPILEDSFEALSDEVVQEQPEQTHSQSKKKDSYKKKSHKKAYEKVKEKTKDKTKTKEDKKDKKQYKEKKEKKQW